MKPAIAENRNHRAAILLCAILLLAGLLRIHRLGAQSYWTDEFFTLCNASGRGWPQAQLPYETLVAPPPSLIPIAASAGAAPWWQIWTSLERESHPPLYWIAGRLWMELFGTGEAAVRSLSVIASVIAVALLFDAVRTMHGTAPALWAALLMAVAGPQVRYAQEARQYALAVALAAGSMAALARLEILGANRKRSAGLALAVTLMLLTHYLTLAVVAAEAIYVLVRLRGKSRHYAAMALLAAGVVVAVSWGPFAVEQWPNVTAAPQWLADGAPGHWRRTIARLAALPARHFIDPMPGPSWALGLGGVAFVAIGVSALVRRSDFLLWVLVVSSVAGLALVSDLRRKSEALDVIRYTILMSPALCALGAAAMASAKKPIMRLLVPSGLVVASLAALPDVYRLDAKPDWRILARALRDAAGREAQTLVLFYSPADLDQGFPPTSFMCLQAYLPDWRWPVVLLNGEPSPPLLQRMKTFREVLLVHPNDGSSGRAVPGAQLSWLAFEPGAGAVFRARWAQAGESGATTQRTDGAVIFPRALAPELPQPTPATPGASSRTSHPPKASQIGP